MKSKLGAVEEFWRKRQFALFIVCCIAFAAVMTGISLWLYRSSGAIKLDMSRPGYERVRKTVEKSQDDEAYPSSGKLDKKAVDDFNKRLQKYRDDLDKMETFSSETINDEALNLNNPGEVTEPSSN